MITDPKLLQVIYLLLRRLFLEAYRRIQEGDFDPEADAFEINGVIFPKEGTVDVGIVTKPRH